MAEGTLSSLRRFWRPDINAFLWLILGIPGLLFFQTTVHEGTHALIAFQETHKFPTLFPFVHDSRVGVTIPEDNEKVTVTEPTSCDRSDPPETYDRLAGFIGWPQIVDLILIAGFTAIFLLWNLRNPLVAYAMRAWYISACIDLLFNTFKILIFSCDASQDWARVMIRSDINHGLFWVVTLIVWVAVVSHLLWVRWTKWVDEPLEETRFEDYRWFALFFAAMSAISLLVVWLVEDSEIDKNALTTLEVVGQFAGLIFYCVYFWWAVTRAKKA